LLIILVLDPNFNEPGSDVRNSMKPMFSTSMGDEPRLQRLHDITMRDAMYMT
jgi:hypothetical protein